MSMTTPSEPPRHPRPLERGWIRFKLIRELAVGEKTREQLADEYNTSVTSISNFKLRHRIAIEEKERDLEAEFAGLWIVDKALRLAELQADVEEIDWTDAEDPKIGVDLLKVKHAALFQAAKELGQIPSTAGVRVETQQATFKINGVDLDQLR